MAYTRDLLQTGTSYARVDRAVHCELGVGEVRVPIVLKRSDKTPKVLFKGAVYALCLTVALRTVRNGHVERCSDSLKDVLPELGEELRVAVGDNARGHAVMSPDVVDE